MTEYARIFTTSETVARALASAPALHGRVHRLSRVRDVELPGDGLFVARVPDAAWHPPEVMELGPGVLQISDSDGRDPRFEQVQAWGPGHNVADFSRAFERFAWLAAVWPPAACVRYLRGLAGPDRPVAYHHCMERGDDPYYEFAWLASGTEALVVEQTYLVSDDEGVFAFEDGSDARVAARRRSGRCARRSGSGPRSGPCRWRTSCAIQPAGLEVLRHLAQAGMVHIWRIDHRVTMQQPPRAQAGPPPPQ